MTEQTLLNGNGETILDRRKIVNRFDGKIIQDMLSNAQSE